MKKLITLTLTLAMVLSMAACGNKTDDDTEPTPTPVVTEEPENTEKPTETPDAETPAPSEKPETPAPTQKPEEKPAEKPVTPAPTEKPAETPAPEQSGSAMSAADLTTLMESILAGADEVNTGTISELPKDNDNYQYNLYIDYTEGYECVTYAPMMSSNAYFVALLSVPDGVDVAALADTIEAGADPNKWICVSADTVDTVVNGNVILFYMIDSAVYGNTAGPLTENFQNASI